MRREHTDEIIEQSKVSIESILRAWLPDGRVEGADYVALNPTRNDRKPGSFRVDITDGKWIDFATDDRGGNLVSLSRYLHGGTISEAAERVRRDAGLSAVSASTTTRSTPLPATPPATPTTTPTTTPPAKPTRGSPWEPILPVPDDAAELFAEHGTIPIFSPRMGQFSSYQPSMAWAYRSPHGELLGYVIRLDNNRGERSSKSTMTVTFCRNRDTGERVWCLKGFPSPRPLYGLEQCTAHPNALVVVCEGEKAVKGVQRLVAQASGDMDIIAVTSPGGSKAPKRTNWHALKDRRVVIWPDADDAGCDYACTVAQLAQAADGIGSGDNPAWAHAVSAEPVKGHEYYRRALSVLPDHRNDDAVRTGSTRSCAA